MSMWIMASGFPRLLPGPLLLRPLGRCRLDLPALRHPPYLGLAPRQKGLGRTRLQKQDAGMEMDGAGAGLYEVGLERNAANTAPLTPVTFLRRAAAVYPNKPAVVHGAQRFTYAQFSERACRLASALRRRGLKRGACVAVMAPNPPPMLEAHYEQKYETQSLIRTSYGG